VQPMLGVASASRIWTGSSRSAMVFSSQCSVAVRLSGSFVIQVPRFPADPSFAGTTDRWHARSSQPGCNCPMNASPSAVRPVRCMRSHPHISSHGLTVHDIANSALPSMQASPDLRSHMSCVKTQTSRCRRFTRLSAHHVCCWRSRVAQLSGTHERSTSSLPCVLASAQPFRRLCSCAKMNANARSNDASWLVSSW